MIKQKLLFLFVFLFAFLFFANAHPAHAYAYETSHNKTCSSFSINGTSNAPYVAVSIYNGESLFLDIFPVTNGSFSVSVNYPQQPEGSTLLYNVWGNLSATDPWSGDGEFMIQIEEPCSVLPLPPYISLLSSSMRCNSFTASAWTTAPYIGLEIRTTNGTLLYTGKFVTATGSNLTSINANFARQNANVSLQYRLWPSNSATVTAYDGSSGSSYGTKRCIK